MLRLLLWLGECSYSFLGEWFHGVYMHVFIFLSLSLSIYMYISLSLYVVAATNVRNGSLELFSTWLDSVDFVQPPMESLITGACL